MGRIPFASPNLSDVSERAEPGWILLCNKLWLKMTLNVRFLIIDKGCVFNRLRMLRTGQ